MKQPNEKALYVLDMGPDGNTQQLCLHMMIRQAPYKPELLELCFHDTDRGHMIRGKMKSTQEHGFTWTDWRGDDWTFREVTIQEFRNSLWQYVGNGYGIAKAIHTTEDLWEWYRKTFPI